VLAESWVRNASPGGPLLPLDNEPRVGRPSQVAEPCDKHRARDGRGQPSRRPLGAGIPSAYVASAVLDRVGRPHGVYDIVRVCAVVNGSRQLRLPVPVNLADKSGELPACRRPTRARRHGLGVRLNLGAEPIGRLSLEDRSDGSGGCQDPRRVLRGAECSIRRTFGRSGRRLRLSLVPHRPGARPHRPDVKQGERKASDSVAVRPRRRGRGCMDRVWPRASQTVARRRFNDAG
jgi:hypothetical protein